jgi:hypothetical protein
LLERLLQDGSCNVEDVLVVVGAPGHAGIAVTLLLVGELGPVAGADLLSEDAQVESLPVVQLRRDRWWVAGRRFGHLIDGETVRFAALSNRVPTAVLVLEVLGSALALGLLAAYLAIVGRGVLAVLLASGLVAFLLLVTADLDRPTRGMIRIPDTALTNQLASMTEPPAATAPRSPSR